MDCSGPLPSIALTVNEPPTYEGNLRFTRTEVAVVTGPCDPTSTTPLSCCLQYLATPATSVAFFEMSGTRRETLDLPAAEGEEEEEGV